MILYYEKIQILATFLVFLISQTYFVQAWIVEEGEKSCGTIYSEINYSGGNISLGQLAGIQDLRQEYLADNRPTTSSRIKSNGNWLNSVKSVRVEPHCFVKVCDQVGLEGSCNTVNGSTDSFQMPMTTSVGCYCVPPGCDQPKCDVVKFQTKDCARAFIEPGCATCKNIYMSMKKGEQIYFGAKYPIKSLKVKKGCVLTTFENTDYEGAQAGLKGGTYEGWTGTIGSYNCTCPAEPEKKNPIKLNNGVPLLNITSSTRVDQIQALGQQYPRHIGVLSALSSVRSKRNPANAYILLVGMTGSGKSATINFLFDSEVTPTGKKKSTTKEIHEFTIPVRLPDLGLEHSNLIVIDTPGLGDTEGKSNDAMFLATLEHYLTTHPELKNRVPNVVLIFGKFFDNRGYGKSAEFVKTLRGIELLKDRLFDQRYSNVVFVFTHFMSETKKVIKNPSSKLTDFQDTIEAFSNMPKPITLCVAENKPQDQEVPMVNGFYQLPNGEFYPRNLFDKIRTVCVNGKDPIGEAVIREAFKHPEDFKITERKIPLLSMNFSRSGHFLDVLNSGEIDVQVTMVSNLTTTAFQKLPQSQQTEEKTNLRLLNRYFNVKNIFTLDDVPKTTDSILRLLDGHKRITPVMKSVLETALGIRVPEISINLLVGNGYDVLRDLPLTTSPFKEGKKVSSDIVFLFPDHLTLKIWKKTNSIFEFFPTIGKARLHRGNKIAGTQLQENLLKGSLSNGYNCQSCTSSNTSEVTLTAVREHQQFDLTLNAPQYLQFDPDFLQELTALAPYNSSDHENVRGWQDYFMHYGTHVVQRAYGGGSMMFTIYAKNFSTPTEAYTEMGELLNTIVGYLDDIYVGNYKSTKTISNQDERLRYTISYLGGSNRFYATDLEKLDAAATTHLLSSWEDSLTYHPIMLEHDIAIQPIYDYLRKSQPKEAKKLEEASKKWLQAELVFIPPPPPPPREDTTKIETLTAEFQEKVKILTQQRMEDQLHFLNMTAKLEADLAAARLLFAEKLMNYRRDAYKDVSLMCFYEKENLQPGNRLCGANADTCVNYRLGGQIKSIDTYNSCAQLFDEGSCSGNMYTHVSNETYNTKMPFLHKSGEWISARICPLT